jgi:hypothetical protein
LFKESFASLGKFDSLSTSNSGSISQANPKSTSQFTLRNGLEDSVEVSSILEKYSDKLLEIVTEKMLEKMRLS